VGEWSAPVDRWVRRATDLDDKLLGGRTILVLDDLWSKADAPSKREPGAAFVYGYWVSNAGIAAALGVTLRVAERAFATLVASGLAVRGRGVDAEDRKVRGVWLADVPHSGRFETVKKDGCETGVEFAGEPWPMLPPTDGDGYMYVLAFDDGLVKFGQTKSPNRRLAEFRALASRYGRVLTGAWLSEPTSAFLCAEAVLGGAVIRSGGRARAGREYLDGIQFDLVVALAGVAIAESEAS